jgi:hypothetical protein
VAQATFGGSTLNLTASGFDESVFKVSPGTIAGRSIGCRWLDDGVDQEFAYFDLGPKSGGSQTSLSVSFMVSALLSTCVSCACVIYFNMMMFKLI